MVTSLRVPKERSPQLSNQRVLFEHAGCVPACKLRGLALVALILGSPACLFTPAGVLASDSTLQRSSALDSALKNAKLLLHTHTRLELVDDHANDLDNATALTHRTYLGIETGEVKQFSARVALENVAHLIDDFTIPGEASGGFDTVADPQGTEVEEAFLSYSGFSDTTVRLGRQYVTYRPAPQHRFIGTVPWRQNWQSMDALTVQNRSIRDLTINYAFVDNVNRIFGEDNPNRDLANSPMQSHLLNLQYSGLPAAAVEAFYYRLDYDRDNLPAPFTDRETLGVKLQGARPITETLTASYLAELSHQRAIADNRTTFASANQYRIELWATQNYSSGGLKNTGVKLGYEVLESDGGLSFATPLATVHAFQGWADRFIGFPDAGVEDLYIAGSAQLRGNIQLTAVLHDFSFAAGRGDYGRELDFQASKKLGRFTISFKHASFFGSDNPAAGAAGADKTVSWMFLDFVY